MKRTFMATVIAFAAATLLADIEITSPKEGRNRAAAVA